MSESPLVSVIVPSYKAAAYLGPLCQSLQAQTYKNFEVLIGDDGSPDNAAEAVAPFLADPRFRFISWKPNRGVSRATVTLLAEAKGEFWCYPGADDLLHPDFIAERTKFLLASPQAVLAHGPPIHIDGNGEVISLENIPEKSLVLTQGPSLEQLLQHNTINTPGVMIRMSVTRQVLPFFSTAFRYSQDWFLWLLLAATGHVFLIDPLPRHRYRVHSTSLTGSSEMASHRQAETRLTPLCALAAAAQLSSEAGLLWTHWRQALYALWLTRSTQLYLRGLLRDEWLQMGAQAYYGHRSNRVFLGVELVRHAFPILIYFIAEQAAIRRQVFRVSGLALVDDPVFSKNPKN